MPPTPSSEQDNDARKAEKEDGEGDDPGDVVEASAKGSGEDARAVGGGEGVEDARIGGAGVDLGMQGGYEAGGVGAADVVALEQDFGAAAGTHEFVAELVKAAGG